MKDSEHIYSLELTKRQAQLLSWTCDTMARIIEGQDHTYQEFFEQAWEKRAKEATGNFMDQEFEGGWYEMRHDAERICKEIKKRFWGLDYQTLNGIHYDESGDTIWDIYRVIRHQLWLDNPDRSSWTVDAENPYSSIGTEPLAKIKRIKE